MFSAFFSLLPKNRHYTAVISTRLFAIFERSFPTINIIEGTQKNIEGLKKKHFDAYCFMGCLPRILNKSIPNNLAFLKTTPYSCKKYMNKTQSKKIRVGISWRGGTEIEQERRTINLKIWLPLLKIPEVSFINLQYDVQQTEIELLKSHEINIFSDKNANALEDMNIFSSLIYSCDIIITVDNSTAHLAGALGIPTWILLPNVPNWRWGKNGDKSYWYESVSLFRQSDDKCWGNLMNKVATQLAENINN